MKHSATVASTFLLLVLWGCGANSPSGNPGPNSTSILYANTASGVLAFTVNADGSLSPLPKPLTQNVGPAIAASQSFILAGDSAAFGTTVDSMQPMFPSGALHDTSQAGFPIIGGTTINILTTCGTQLFAGDVNGALVVYSVGSQGGLTQAGQITGFLGAPWSATVDKTCTNIYVSDTATPSVYAFQNTNGSLSSLPGSPFTAGGAAPGKGLFGISIDASGKFLYVANQTEGKLYGFVIGPNGALTSVPGSPFSSGTTPVAALAVSLSSMNFLYATDTAASTITSYRIDSNTGALSRASSVNTASGPEYLMSFGTVLYSANVQGSSISAFQLQNDGTLTQVPGSPFTLGAQPLGAAIVVTGQ